MNLNTQNLVHIGVELVVVGGVIFWTNKRISTLESRIDELNTKLKVYEDMILQQRELLTRHEQILRAGASIQMRPSPQPRSPPQPPPSTPSIVELPDEEEESPPPPKVTKPEVSSIKSEDLDKILTEEIENLNKPPEIEVPTITSKPRKHRLKKTTKTPQ